MKILEHIERTKSVKEFFNCYRRTKFLIIDSSRLKEVNLIRLISDLSDKRLYETEFCAYFAGEGFRTIDFSSNVNQIFNHSIGVVALECDLDEITLFETEEDLDCYVDAYRSSYLEDSIAFEVTGEMIDEYLEQDRQNRIRSLKESIKDYQKSIDRMTKELEELEKISEM